MDIHFLTKSGNFAFCSVVSEVIMEVALIGDATQFFWVILRLEPDFVEAFCEWDRRMFLMLECGQCFRYLQDCGLIWSGIQFPMSFRYAVMMASILSQSEDDTISL